MTQRIHAARGVSVCILAAVICASGMVCPGGGGGGITPFFSPLDYIEISDAVVGQKGKIRVLLANPTSGDTSVALSSSDPAIITVPASVTVPSGRLTADAEYDAMAPGTALVMASLGGATEDSSAIVQSSLILDSFSTAPFVPLEVGAKGYSYVGFNMSLAEPEVINLTSSDPSVISVPASVTVEQFASSTAVALTANAVGTAVITAEFDGMTLSRAFSVVSEAALTNLSGFNDRVVVGTSDSFNIELSAIVSEPTTVMLNSSNDSAISVPSTAVVNPGEYFTGVPAQALAAGAATVTATLDGVERIVNITVVSEPTLSSFSASDSMLVGGVQYVYVYFDATAIATETINLSSSNPAVVAVPATINVPAGSSSAFLQVSGLSAGLARITAEFNGEQAVFFITVSNSPSIETLSIEDYVETGGLVAGFVGLDHDALADTTVTLMSSNPATVSLPTTLVIPAGNYFAYFYTTATAEGFSVVTATLNGASRSQGVFVVDDVHLTSASGGGTFQVGAVASLNVGVNAAVAQNTTVTINNLSPGLLSVPTSSLTIPVGTTSTSLIGLRGLAAGRADLEISLNGQTLVEPYTFVTTVSLTSLSTPVTPKVGGVGEMTVNINAVPLTDQVVALMSNDVTRVIVPASVTIPAGRSSISFEVQGVANMMATITASLNGGMVMTNVTPIP